MKRKPLKYIALLILSVIIILISVSSVGRVLINKRFVSGYYSGQYDTEAEKRLLFLNFPEGYIPYYNLGNVAFQNKEYVSAVSYFTDALKYNPKEPEDCLIRINLALSLCYTIDFNNLDSDEKVQTALFTLYQARDVLLANGCATDEEGQTGHNKDAQQLKEDIDKMIEKLQQGSDSDDQNDQNQDQQNNDQDDQNEKSSGSSNSNKQKQQQQALEQNKKGAMEERKEEIDQLDNYKKYNNDGDANGGSQESQDGNPNSGGGSDEGNGSGDEEGGDGQEAGPKHPW